MKTLLYILSCLLSLLLTKPVQAQTKTHTLTFTIKNLEQRQGTIHVGLVTKAENFMGKSEIDTIVAVPASGPVTITFANLPTGTYAAQLYQDVNNNKQMDMAGSRPTEPFGFSKIAMLMGPPSFEAASFALAEDTELKIVLLSL
ncbi:DUF2141 domain-containing protein [Fibrella sp. HMF5335]|uniref:DUF2141 domain-containing protein n=1 Tax=Fibrella rubiginis TaxID=2817060 RepID=A0A939GLJ9_9BACT|nr:DUF2141 domain-containing protein [Fibrella rubiginis]MBO0938976.1 DUF2141 domain-containing protein [Fibrella rubiginis]